MEKQYWLLLGMADLFLSYLLFTGQQYFSAFALVGIFAMALLASAAIIIPGASERYGGDRRLFLAMFAASALLAVCEALFDRIPSGAFTYITIAVMLISAATAVTIVGVYLLGRGLHLLRGRLLTLACALVGMAVISTVAYFVMYGWGHQQWAGDDVMVFDYYAASLFLQGHNPYAANMSYILNQYGTPPTILLNGTYVHTYDYPAFSFLQFIFIPLLGIKSLFSFIALMVLFTVSYSFIVYYRSGRSKPVLLLLAAWILLSYAFVVGVVLYLAIPIVLLFAYLYRGRPLVSGVLMGIAASTQQLIWFALPFLYVAILREKGWKQAAIAVAASVAVFVAINGLFVVTYPKAFYSVFLPFGVEKLPSLAALGPNISEFTTIFYPLPYWYAAFTAILAYGVLLAAYYAYPKVLRVLPALAPIVVFFFSWRNTLEYCIPFIPLVIAAYFCNGEGWPGDVPVRGRTLALGAAAVAILVVALAVPLHNAYASGDRLAITKVMPTLGVSQTNSGTEFDLIRLNVTVNNTFDRNETVSLYVLSRNPRYETYFPGSELPQVGALSSRTLSVQFQAAAIGNGTQLFISAFSSDYVTAYVRNFTGLKAS